MRSRQGLGRRAQGLGREAQGSTACATRGLDAPAVAALSPAPLALQWRASRAPDRHRREPGIWFLSPSIRCERITSALTVTCARARRRSTGWRQRCALERARGRAHHAPSHATLLTGRYPPGHGARDNGLRVSPTVPTLATELQARGFRTAAFVAAFPLDHQFGLNRGFDVYSDHLPRGSDGRLANERPASQVIAEAITWLRQRSPEPPAPSPKPPTGFSVGAPLRAARTIWRSVSARRRPAGARSVRR